MVIKWPQISTTICISSDKKREHHENTPIWFWPPLTPVLYSKTGVYRGIHYFFLFLFKNIDCGYSLEPPRRGGSNEYPQSMFWAEIWKLSVFFIWKFPFFLVLKFSVYLNRYVFVMMYRIDPKYSYGQVWSNTVYSLTRSPRDSLKYFKISKPRYIRFEELRKR